MKYKNLAGKRPATMALAIIASAALAAGVGGGAQAAPKSSDATAVYLVQTVSEAAANYEGGIAGFAATKPQEGKRIDARGSAVKEWLKRLSGEHGNALRGARVDAGKKVYDYGLTFNGFSARLTGAEVARLQADKNVVRVWKSELRTIDTTNTRDFLGLSGASGVWAKQFGSDKRAGEGVIVGVIDSGLWADNASFAPLPTPRPDQWLIDWKWNGVCNAGEEEPIACSNKVIGARYYHQDVAVPEFEYMGPRDFHGHGTHTASTAAGNFGVPAEINHGSVGTTSGVAPAARLAIYKALWRNSDANGNPIDGASGGTADLVAAIEDAVSDGVDVINYSISGSRNLVIDPAEIAFFNAAAAGVFVAASAGNSGADLKAGSVAHNSPWLTTVAASTHDRGNTKTLTLGNGAKYTGVGVNGAAINGTLVDSEMIPAAGRTAADARLCVPGSIDPAKAAGKIVFCTRGLNARVEKSAVVQAAGGIGMIMGNPSANSLNGDFHSVPSIHLNHVDGPAVKAYIASIAEPTGALSVLDTTPVRAPMMAGFSSYGPALAGQGDLLKPDITAPGADVIAAVAPPGNGGENFNSYSGTSMSAPHVAGVAALLKSKNQLWSPMWIKSAMMTTASTKDNTGAQIQWTEGDATPLNYGSGHVVPGSAFDPGLVYDSGPKQWKQYMCAVGQLQQTEQAKFCEKNKAVDASDLNYPSISVGDLPHTQKITRTVTNVTARLSTYEVEVKAPAGHTVTVSPKKFTMLPFGSQKFTVTITRTDAALGEWKFGSLTWKDGRGHRVTSPIAVRPVGISGPADLSGTGASGSMPVAVRTGFAGTMNTTVGGLVGSDIASLAFTAPDRTFNKNNRVETGGTKKFSVTFPAETALARIALFDSEAPMGTDLDLFVVDTATGLIVAESTGGTAEESATVPPGTYEVWVNYFAGSGELTAKNHVWSVPSSPTGNTTATPASQPATAGGPAQVTLSWTGLTAGTRYLGVVIYSNGAVEAGRTIVSVNP